jgi:putative dimethyl sulfoxide reductase chaperone
MTDTLIAPRMTEDWTARVAGQALVFQLLGKLVYEPPEADWLQSLAGEAVFDEIPFAAAQPEVITGLGLLQAWTRAYRAGEPSASFEALRADYTRLFVGLGQVLAPPWESVQVDEEGMLFQEETLQVRAWYRRFGLEAERLYQEPDDHAGLELAFLAHLAQLALAAQSEGSPARLRELLEAQGAFLRTHASRWIFKWCAQVHEHARTDFYRGVAHLTAGALTELTAALRPVVPLETL